MRKLLDIIILALLFALVCLNAGRFFGKDISCKVAPQKAGDSSAQPVVEAKTAASEQTTATDNSKAAAESSSAEAQTADVGEGAVALEEAKELFPEATSLTHRQNGVYEVNGAAGLLGFIMKSVPYSNDIAGFMGPTPLMIALDAEMKVTKVHALKNDETPRFFEHVKKKGLLDRWNGLTPSEVVTKEVEAVSGATFSSKSVIDSMQARMKNVGDLTSKPAPTVVAESAPVVEENQTKETDQPRESETQPARTDWLKLAADICFCLLLLVALLGVFRPAALGKTRNLLLLASILVLAIWQGRLLSMAQFVAWLTGGVPVAAQWAMLLLFLLSVLVPLIFGKAYYCTWVCPMGAAQALLGELNKKHKLKLGPTIAQWLSTIRTAILFSGLLAIGFGLSFDFADYEAFTVFRPQSAPIAALCIGIISLLLSIWIPRPWCRFLCPLGELLEILRRKK